MIFPQTEGRALCVVSTCHPCMIPSKVLKRLLFSYLRCMSDNMLASEGPKGLPRVPRYCLS